MGIVKKSFFDMIASKIENSIFLDLFAGTGSVGIEALYREAKKVIFVEKNYAYAESIRKKVEHLYDKERYKIYKIDTYRFLSFPIVKTVDIVYVDPPYDFLNISRGKEFLQKLFQKANKNCIITVEHRVNRKLDKIYAGFYVYKIKQLGETELTIYKGKE
jgi:16S rRNA (guanine966-N2)-methyltransferase